MQQQKTSVFADLSINDKLEIIFLLLFSSAMNLCWKERSRLQSSTCDSIDQCCIVYRYLYSASHGVSQTEAHSVHFSSRKKVRLKARERERERRGIGAERLTMYNPQPV